VDGNGVERALAREDLPAEARDALASLRQSIERDYARLLEPAVTIDPTLRKPVESARNSALVGVGDVEKRLISHLKRQNEIVTGQLTRARTAMFPLGQEQERVLGAVSFLVRYGPDFITRVHETIATWVDSLEPVPGEA
jgi:uncharacterized protein YllA (UPF0747 family)